MEHLEVTTVKSKASKASSVDEITITQGEGSQAQRGDTESITTDDESEDDTVVTAVTEKPYLPERIGFDTVAVWPNLRRILAEDQDWSLATIPYLSELNLRFFVDNFSNNTTILDHLPPKQRQSILDRLPTTLPLKITALLIEDEGYWMRCSYARWQVLDVSGYGGSWKRLFFERNLQEIIENFVPEHTDSTELEDTVKLSANFIRKLDIRQLLPPVKVSEESVDDDEEEDEELKEINCHHMDLHPVVTGLPNLEVLHVTYRVRDCGMNFEWRVFKFTSRDCLLLASAVAACQGLRVLRLHQSRVDDEKAKVFISKILDHEGLKELDLSTNLIGDYGTRALARFLSKHSHLVRLDLKDNQIRTKGAQALAHALMRTTTLQFLNLRNNQVGDEGGQALCRALSKNESLMEINLSSNDIGEPAAAILAQSIKLNNTLQVIDLSCNRMGMEAGRQLKEGMEHNSTIVEMDLRLTDCGQESEYCINLMLHANQERARDAALREKELRAPPQRKKMDPQFAHRFHLPPDHVF